jgi:hypothetical protein
MLQPAPRSFCPRRGSAGSAGETVGPAWLLAGAPSTVALVATVRSTTIRILVREGRAHQIANLMQTGKAAGNQLLNDALAALVAAGTVDAAEALSRSVDKAELARRLGRPPVES